MTERRTRLAREVPIGEQVMDRGVLHLVTFVQTVGETTLLVFANNWTVAVHKDLPIELATAAEIREARRTAEETGRGLVNFPTARFRRDGFAPASGHAAMPPADTFRHDGRYDGDGGAAG